MQEITTRAPGRINLIGEHIDYLDGFVMPAAINLEVSMHLVKNGSPSVVNALAKDIDESFSFDLKAYQPLSNGWQNYIMGVFHELEKLGADMKGCDISFSSTVPIGAGLSSSAALECSLALALNELWELNFSRVQLAQAAQMAEHNFVGIQCGIMDQFASMMGKENEVLLLDCQNLQHTYHPLHLDEYTLLLLDSHVSHELANSAYNDRRATSEKGLSILKSNFPHVKTFRDAQVGELDTLKTEMGDITYRRSLHAITEIQRTHQACEAIANGDLENLGNLLYEGHESLKNDYEVTCSETDFLVDLTKDNPRILGARQMGGGFGGCTINLIKTSHLDAFIDAATAAYRSQFQKSPTPYLIDIADGASIVSSK